MKNTFLTVVQMAFTEIRPHQQIFLTPFGEVHLDLPLELEKYTLEDLDVMLDFQSIIKNRKDSIEYVEN